MLRLILILVVVFIGFAVWADYRNPNTPSRGEIVLRGSSNTIPNMMVLEYANKRGWDVYNFTLFKVAKSKPALWPRLYGEAVLICDPFTQKWHFYGAINKRSLDRVAIK